MSMKGGTPSVVERPREPGQDRRVSRFDSCPPNHVDWNIARALVSCQACVLWFRTRGVPCMRHTHETERAARAQRIGVVR